MCFDVSFPIRLIWSTDGPLCLRSATMRGASTPSFVSGAAQSPPDLIGEVLAELQRPLPHTLVADNDAARGQHLLDHAQAEREAKIQPDRVADDLSGKAMPGIAGANGCRHPVRLPDLLPIRKPASSQVDGADKTGMMILNGSLLAEHPEFIRVAHMELKGACSSRQLPSGGTNAVLCGVCY